MQVAIDDMITLRSICSELVSPRNASTQSYTTNSQRPSRRLPVGLMKFIINENIQVFLTSCLLHLSSSSSQVGSPSALSDPDLNQKLRQAAQTYGRTLYVPSGALWGGQDIQRMSDSGTLTVG